MESVWIGIIRLMKVPRESALSEICTLSSQPRKRSYQTLQLFTVQGHEKGFIKKILLIKSSKNAQKKYGLMKNVVGDCISEMEKKRKSNYWNAGEKETKHSVNTTLTPYERTQAFFGLLYNVFKGILREMVCLMLVFYDQFNQLHILYWLFTVTYYYYFQ